MFFTKSESNYLTRERNLHDANSKKEFNSFFNTDGRQLKQPVQVFSTMSFHYAF